MSMGTRLSWSTACTRRIGSSRPVRSSRYVGESASGGWTSLPRAALQKRAAPSTSEVRQSITKVLRRLLCMSSSRARSMQYHERGKIMGLELTEQVAVLRMDFGKANAIGEGFLERMSGLLDEVSARKARALVLTGDGRIFCAGLDLPSLVDRGAEEIAGFIARFSRFMLRVFELPIPVVAA